MSRSTELLESPRERLRLRCLSYLVAIHESSLFQVLHNQPPPLQAKHQPDESAEEALSDFVRFPRWMWRCHAVREYAEWCRQFNSRLAERPSRSRLPAGWFGMDLYSLFTSADAVIAFLEGVDKRAAERARQRYSTLGQFRHESAEYGVAVHLGIVESQEKECARMLVELLKRGPEALLLGSAVFKCGTGQSPSTATKSNPSSSISRLLIAARMR